MKDYSDLESKLSSPFSILGDSERFADFLTVLAHFPELSEKNVQLIAHQRPGAVMLATFSTWKALGTPVRANEKAIVIRNMRGSGWMPVFDISQTSAKRTEPQVVADIGLILAASVLLTESNREGLDWSPQAYIDAYIRQELASLPQRSSEELDTLRDCMRTVINTRYLRPDAQSYPYIPDWTAGFDKDKQAQLLTTIYRLGKRILRNIEQSLDQGGNLPVRHCGYLKSAEVV